jgi:hypothetical protein
MTKKALTNEESVALFGELGREIPADMQPTLRRLKGYIPGFPLRILCAVVEAKAEKARPLVLAIHRQMVMTRESSIPLSGAIWDAAGSPGKRERVSVLRNLRKLRKIIRLTAKQTMFSYYRASYGPLWSQKDPE